MEWELPRGYQHTVRARGGFAVSSPDADGYCWRSGMGTSARRTPEADAVRVRFSDDSMSVDLNDGRTITVPLTWYPRLLRGTKAERQDWQLSGCAGGKRCDAASPLT